MGRFNVGFWNYVRCGALDEKSVKDWHDLGMNMAMSWEFDPDKEDKAVMLRTLDECVKYDIQVIVCDKRAHWKTYTALGEEKFEQGVKEAVEDFGSHPAVIGFHVGDEPMHTEFSDATAAYKIVKRCAPHLKPFLNMLPLWEEPNFEKCLGVPPEKYGDALDKLCVDGNLEMLCYDYYGQCAYFDKEIYRDLYFKNLNLFRKSAEKNGVEFWTTLLSTGHWSLRCPNEDDFRWQIASAVAHGVKNILWFFVYERTLDSSFRVPPIDLFNERTETFEWLSRQNRTFLKFFAEKVADLDLVSVKHVNKCYGGTAEFDGADELKEIVSIINPSPLIVSRFKNKETGKIVYLLVNNNQFEPTKVETHFDEAHAKSNGLYWLAPGQMVMIEL